ncbi:MAG: glycosyltransferase family 4 protein [Capsulimonadaceae bacterium]
MSAEKGIPVLIEALARIGSEPVHCVIVGTGPEESAIRRLVRARKLTQQVTFAGFIPSVNEAIEAIDALALPSVWPEPCAAVVSQAMAMSKPVVASATGGTPELVAHAVTGLLVPPGNPDALADALKTLACDPELCRSLGSAGLERVREKFTLGRMVDRIEDLYYEALGPRSSLSRC